MDAHQLNKKMLFKCNHITFPDELCLSFFKMFLFLNFFVFIFLVMLRLQNLTIDGGLSKFSKVYLTIVCMYFTSIC